MKKIASFGIGVLLMTAFASCEKNYTCTCTYPTAAVGTTKTTFKAKKADAEASCAMLNTNAQLSGGACAL
jgi:hypothetical protein